MIAWKLTEIAEAVGGELINAPREEPIIKGVQQDSRKIKKDFLFVPLVAERDGHDFLEQAAEAGAVASFWSKDLEKAPTDFPLILVDDNLTAMQDLAVWYLGKVDPEIVAITGSNGKTTTKDMTAKILSAKYRTHKTAGNFNNHIGLPLTILSMPADTEIVVLEMGTSHPGEIEFLSELVQPDLAVLTMVGESHIEAFGSRENLAKEKLSISASLKNNGLFIYPADENLITRNLPRQARLKNFAIEGSADLSAENIIEDKNKTEFTVIEKENKEMLTMTLPIPGRYNVNNALIAILIGLEYGISLTTAKEQLAQLELTKDRLEWIEGVNEWSLLNDAYNASPTSVRAVLRYFQALETSSEKVLVLGDILELGEASATLHASLAEVIDLEKSAYIFLYGPQMKALYQVLKKRDQENKVYHFENDKEELQKALTEHVKEGSELLFKSSNGTDLLSVVDHFRLKKTKG